MTRGLTHPCPGCGEVVLDTRLSCTVCWFRLPKVLRDAVTRAHQRIRIDGAMPHLRAMGDVMRWYRDHPS